MNVNPYHAYIYFISIPRKVYFTDKLLIYIYFCVDQFHVSNLMVHTYDRSHLRIESRHFGFYDIRGKCEKTLRVHLLHVEPIMKCMLQQPN